MIKALSFDIDGTITPPRGLINNTMAQRLSELSHKYVISLLSGGDISAFKSQVLKHLPSDFNYDNLYLYPATGSKHYKIENGKLVIKYIHLIDQRDRDNIILYLTQRIDELKSKGDINFEIPSKEMIEDRGSQITFSGVGLDASRDLKNSWDPNSKKRSFITAETESLFPKYLFAIAGSSSIDITKKGVDKALAMKDFIIRSGIKQEEIVFFGDRLSEGGNDFCVKNILERTFPVVSWEDTIRLLEDY